MSSTSNIPVTERALAAANHLGYIGLGLMAGLLVGAPRKGLVLLVVLGALLAISYVVARSSEFVREHGRQARGYHKLGATLGLAAAAFVIWVAIFTWGLGLPLALLLIPAAIYWMAPTFMGAGSALRGNSYRYPTLRWFRAAKEGPTPIDRRERDEFRRRSAQKVA